jgi:hypothetical protein
MEEKLVQKRLLVKVDTAEYRVGIDPDCGLLTAPCGRHNTCPETQDVLDFEKVESELLKLVRHIAKCKDCQEEEQGCVLTAGGAFLEAGAKQIVDFRREIDLCKEKIDTVYTKVSESQELERVQNMRLIDGLYCKECDRFFETEKPAPRKHRSKCTEAPQPVKLHKINIPTKRGVGDFVRVAAGPLSTECPSSRAGEDPLSPASRADGSTTSPDPSVTEQPSQTSADSSGMEQPGTSPSSIMAPPQHDSIDHRYTRAENGHESAAGDLPTLGSQGSKSTTAPRFVCDCPDELSTSPTGVNNGSSQEDTPQVSEEENKQKSLDKGHKSHIPRPGSAQPGRRAISSLEQGSAHEVHRLLKHSKDSAVSTTSTDEKNGLQEEEPTKSPSAAIEDDKSTAKSATSSRFTTYRLSQSNLMPHSDVRTGNAITPALNRAMSEKAAHHEDTPE